MGRIRAEAPMCFMMTSKSKCKGLREEVFVTEPSGGSQLAAIADAVYCVDTPLQHRLYHSICRSFCYCMKLGGGRSATIVLNVSRCR